MATENAEPILKQLILTRAELARALSTGDFYLEWLVIGLALALSGLLAVLVRKRVAARLAASPPKRIDAEFITRPLLLLAPLFALFYLAIAQPIFVENGGGVWIMSMKRLTVAYLLARAVMLMVSSRPVAWLIAVVIMASAVLKVTGFADAVVGYLDGIDFSIGKFNLSMLAVLNGIVILVIVFWAAGLSSRTLESYLRRSSAMSYTARELSVKFFRIFVYFTALLITLSAVGVDLTAFAVFGGALGVGIGLGLQRITANFVSGITLLLEKSVKLGDVIEVGGISGTVRELNIRYALIETGDGRELMVPNDELTSTRVTNWTYSHSRARIEIVVTLDFASDAPLARRLMLEAAEAQPQCLKEPLPTCFLREFGERGLVLVLNFWIADVKEGKLGPQSEVLFRLLARFKDAGIQLAEGASSPKPATAG